MNTDVEFHIKQRYPWTKLPANVKQQLGFSQEEYSKCIKSFSIKNQLRHKGNLIRSVMKDDKRYYESLLRYSREHLMLFPYHLSDVIVKGMRMTPFQYYLNMMQDLMTQEKSYDSLPNFTAADCLRLLGIGRNQYIDLMNQCRSSKRFFRRKPIKEVLPTQPVADLLLEPWWLLQVGYITEDDIKLVTIPEKSIVDKIIDFGPQQAGDMNMREVHSLYRKGLIYVDVPIIDDDCIIVPPLEGFVMNRVLGDYLETLLYKIFVSIDEYTSVSELSNILQIDSDLVKNAVSMYCRLGFAHPKGKDFDVNMWHESWSQYSKLSPKKNPDQEGILLLDWGTSIDRSSSEPESNRQRSPDTSSYDEPDISETAVVGHNKRIAFLFDSTLTAFLMMGNLSPGLKSHAVTMFEVGKLPDESLDSLLTELDKIREVGEGEAQRYFDHALTLQSTVKFLRNNRNLIVVPESNSAMGLDLVRCESLQSLEPATCARLLNKNYALLVSMAPLSNEIRPITSCLPPHLGPAIPEVSSIWLKLFVYHATGHGPPTLLISKGTRMRCLPRILQEYDRLLVTTWGHDPGIVPTSNALLTLNDALTHSAVLVQAYSHKRDGETIFVPFPFHAKELADESGVCHHPAIEQLVSSIDLQHTCGFVTMVHLSQKPAPPFPAEVSCRLEASLMDAGGPLCDSDTEAIWPLDGFTDTRAERILASELDKLDLLGTENSSSDDATSRENVLVSTGVSSSSVSPEAYFGGHDAWTILDCYFGLPLFDLRLNKDICQRILSHSLCNPASLLALTHSNRLLTIHLLEFISGIQGSASASDSRFDPSSASARKSGDLDIPVPSRNLVYANGKLEEWDGR